MKYLNWNGLGGLKFTQNRLGWLQDGMLASFGAMARLCGDKTILFGVEVIAGNVTPGFISYNGELVEFVGGAVAADVKITDSVNSYSYANATVQPVEVNRRAELVAVGDFPFADLKRLPSLFQLNTDFISLLAAFNAHTHAWVDITGKPAGYITYVGNKVIGNPTTDFLVTVAIPDQGGTAYNVIGTLVSNSVDHAIDNDVSWAIREKTNVSFKITLREYEAVAQNLSFDFIIVKTL